MNAIGSTHSLNNDMLAQARNAMVSEQPITSSSAAVEEVKVTQDIQANSLQKFSMFNERELTLREQLEVKRLEQVERSVHEHERSHLRAARDLAISSPSFDYQRGPDGKEYAVGGEVNVSADFDFADAQGTIEKALKIRQAALAPNDPSPKDRRAATEAKIVESKAYRKLNREEAQEVIFNEKELDLSKEPTQDYTPPALKSYEHNRDFQRDLSTMLDLFT